MSRRFTLFSLALSSAVAFLVGIILAGGMSRTPVVSSEPAARPSDRAKSARASTSSVVNFADVAERMNAAVVNIDAASRTPLGRFSTRTPRTDDPADPPRDLDTPRQGSGSGFIIDRAGYILTN